MRRQSELAALARLVANERLSTPARAAAALVAHQRMDAGGCVCGYRALGASHARHVADALYDAGLLVPSRKPETGEGSSE